MARLQGGLRRGRSAAQHGQRGDEEVRRRGLGRRASRSCSSATTPRRSWPRASRSPRDMFQMKDVTRGPSMHNEQFEGLTWLSVPLFDQVHVWLLGASDAASEVAALADHVGFRVTAVDYDPAYVNEARFPRAERIVLPGGNFDALAELSPARPRTTCACSRAATCSTPKAACGPPRHRRALRGHDGLRRQERHACTSWCWPRAPPRSDWDARQAPHRPEVRREDAGRAGHRHRRPSWWTCATSSATVRKRASATRRAWAGRVRGVGF